MSDRAVVRLQQQVSLTVHADGGAGRLRDQELGGAHQLVGQHVDDADAGPTERQLGAGPEPAQLGRRRAEHALAVGQRGDDRPVGRREERAERTGRHGRRVDRDRVRTRRVVDERTVRRPGARHPDVVLGDGRDAVDGREVRDGSGEPVRQPARHPREERCRGLRFSPGRGGGDRCGRPSRRPAARRGSARRASASRRGSARPPAPRAPSERSSWGRRSVEPHLRREGEQGRQVRPSLQ